MSVPKSKRRQSSYEMGYLAREILVCVNNLYYKMYDYSPEIAVIELGAVRHLADNVLEWVIQAQEHPLINPYSRDTFVRNQYLINASTALSALDAFLTNSLLNLNHLRIIVNGKERGVKTHELEEILDYEIKLTDIVKRELNSAKNKMSNSGYSL